MGAQLELQNVSKRFGGVVANDRVSLSVMAGEIIGIIGPNGSGKTTLFNSIVGHHPVDSGLVCFERRNITGLGVAQTARLGVLRTLQQTRTYKGMTCLENLTVSLQHSHLRPAVLARRFPRETARRALELLDFIGMSALRDALSGDLSFGQQRLLELAMAVMNQPRILLLDEPTAGINPSFVNGLVRRLREVNRKHGITLVVIEHNMPVIMELAERVYCLNRGRVLAEGRPERVSRDSAVIDAYLGRQ